MNYLKLAVKIITAVPQIKDLFEGIVSLYYQQKVNELEDALINKKKPSIPFLNYKRCQYLMLGHGECRNNEREQ